MRVMIQGNMNRKMIEKMCETVFDDVLLKNLNPKNISFWVKHKRNSFQVVFQIDRSHFGFAKFKSEANTIAQALLECEKKAKRWVVRCKNNKGRNHGLSIKHIDLAQ